MSPSRLLKALAPQKGAWRGPNCQKSVLGSPDGNLMLSYLISYCLSLYQILFRKMVKRTVSRISLRSSLSKRLVVQKCVDVVTLQRSWLAIDQTPLI